MLKVAVPGREWFDETLEEFVMSKGYVLHLEHSLLSVSKWESKWKIAFLEERTKLTDEQFLDYIRCMTINPPADPFVYANLTVENVQNVQKYITESQTATKIYRPNQRGPDGPKDRVTSELIYYWMSSYHIPFECQKWHLSRLMALLEVCSFKNQPPKKGFTAEMAKDRAARNAARRARLNSKG